MTQEEFVLLQSTTWERNGTQVYLKPSYCNACNQFFFPPIKGCPHCFQQGLEQVPVEEKGVLYSYTTIYVPRKGYPNPYSIGYVDFPNISMRVFGRLTSNGPFHIGMEVSIVDGIVYELEGIPIKSYMFQIQEGA